MAKPANSAKNTGSCQDWSQDCRWAAVAAVSSSMENVSAPVPYWRFHSTIAKRPRNVSMLPANVNRKNLIAAYRRSSLPQIPIRK